MDLKKAKRIYTGLITQLKNKPKFDRTGLRVEMKLSFDEWHNIWINSGKFDERGSRKHQYVMSRRDDLGHYEVGNVYIQTSVDNIKEAYKNFHWREKISVETKKAMARPEVKQHLKDAMAEVMSRPGMKHKISEATKAGMSSFEVREKCAQNQKKQITCYQCGKVGAIRIMARWHGDRCRG